MAVCAMFHCFNSSAEGQELCSDCAEGDDELDIMLDAIKRDKASYFGMGAMRATKKLKNGARVTVSIRMPSHPISNPTEEKR